ncbi:hypothetical protein CMUST_14325 [Corynebacterium mustelae]|uniref:Asp23/Gls24 family envelope stress response protein n=1 Tax=Corynebacterium mustelae TaxID=571915 RepID=A0A0G3H5R5_9CORY|nr:hypothetical protein [Corynebacterium mustelae]AKK07158.1 hypothetical protein CMUST_14325 [Corynebacterium mustelae]
MSDEATGRYLQLIKSLHDEWDLMDADNDESVRPSSRVFDSVMEAVRANARHGAEVHMPATEHGPYTMTELSLRTLVRQAVESVPLVSALCSSFEYSEAPENQRGYGQPTRVRCRISVHVTAKNYAELTARVRDAVRTSCQDNLKFAPDVDIHIEDLHDDDF